MGFLAPWFLAGIAVAGLPLWLHLLRRHRSEPRPFSSLMFFEPRTQSSILHRRLRHLLLLALRLALLLLLALAFANPFVSRPAAAVRSDRILILAIDRSFSMRYGDHLERAKELARAALERSAAGEPVEVAALDSDVAFLTGATRDRAALQAAIASIEPGDGGTSFAALMRGLRGVAESQHKALDVVLFSDMQQTAMPPAFTDLQLPAGTRLTLERVGSGEQPNWTVESVVSPARLFDAKKERVTATIAGYATPAARRTATLTLDGRVLETQAVEVPANGRATVEFKSLESPYGFHRGEVRIDSGDALPRDDRFVFSVERAEPRPVLFLYPGNRASMAFYYRSALEAGGTSGFTLQAQSTGQSAAVEPGKYAFIVLSDVGELPREMEASLRRYVENGGAVLIALGPASAMAGRVPVTGDKVSGQVKVARDAAYQNAAAADPEHPALRNVDLTEVKVYDAVRVEAQQAAVLARLADRTPLLMEERIGSGKALVFGSTLDKAGNDFALHPSFVPFVQQAAGYLGGTASGASNLTVGTFADLRQRGSAGTAVDVMGPNGKRVLSLEEAASMKSLPLSREGFYEIHSPNGRERLIAVNADRRESNLTAVPKETLELWTHLAAPGAGQGAAAGGSKDETRESLGRYLLALVLLAAFAESLVSVRYLWNKEAA